MARHSIECITHARHSIAFLHFVFNWWAAGRGLVMKYPFAKFGDFSFSRFGFIVRTDKHTQ